MNFASTLNSGQNPSLLREDLDLLLYSIYNRTPHPSFANAENPLVFNQGTSEMSTLNAEVSSGLGYFSEIVDGESIPQSESPFVGQPKQYIMREWAKDVKIENRFVKDNRYGYVAKSVASAAKAALATRDFEAMRLWREAGLANSAVSITTDGQPIISANHETVTGVEVDNTVSGPLDVTTLNEAITKLSEQVGQNGIINGSVEGLTLFVPTARWSDAVKLTDSHLEPGVSDNDINFFSRVFPGLRLVCSNLIGTKAGGNDNNWFLMNDQHSVHRWVYEGLTTDVLEPKYSPTRTWLYRLAYREQVGALTYEGVVGHIAS